MVLIKSNKGLKIFKSTTLLHCFDILNCSLDSQVSVDPAHTAARYGSVAALHSLRKNGFNIMLEDQNKVCSDQQHILHLHTHVILKLKDFNFCRKHLSM